jgi:hypothetical protein
VPEAVIAAVVQRTYGAEVRTGREKAADGSTFAAVRQTPFCSHFDQHDQLPLDQYGGIVITVNRWLQQFDKGSLVTYDNHRLRHFIPGFTTWILLCC